MKNSMLIAFNDSESSRAAVDYLTQLPLCVSEFHVTLAHVLRKPSGGEEMMGKKFMRKQPERMAAAMEKAKHQLIKAGCPPDHIHTILATTPYPTVAEGIIDQFNKGEFDLVVVGRKRLSKAEEFVMGDASIKLVRALNGTAVLVVKK